MTNLRFKNFLDLEVLIINFTQSPTKATWIASWLGPREPASSANSPSWLISWPQSDKNGTKTCRHTNINYSPSQTITNISSSILVHTWMHLIQRTLALKQKACYIQNNAAALSMLLLTHKQQETFNIKWNGVSRNLSSISTSAFQLLCQCITRHRFSKTLSRAASLLSQMPASDHPQPRPQFRTSRTKWKKRKQMTLSRNLNLTRVTKKLCYNNAWIKISFSGRQTRNSLKWTMMTYSTTFHLIFRHRSTRWLSHVFQRRTERGSKPDTSWWTSLYTTFTEQVALLGQTTSETMVQMTCKTWAEVFSWETKIRSLSACQSWCGRTISTTNKTTRKWITWIIW